MGPIRATTTCLRKSFDFSGRATRAEFWWFFLATIIVAGTALTVIDMWLLGLNLDENSVFAPVGDTVFLLLLPANLSVTKRRMNDMGGWGWTAVAVTAISVALSFVGPFVDLSVFPTFEAIDVAFIIASLFVVIRAISPSLPGPNQYGPNPHEVSP